MSDIAISVRNLGKQYHIGAVEQNGAHHTYRYLRDSLASAMSAPFRVVLSLLGRGGNWEDIHDRKIWALKDVSFEVKRGDILGVIGRNGAGKSTLLKVLSRITEPSTGRAEIHGRIGSLLEVGTGFHPELTGRDNVYLNGAILGMKRAEIARQFDEIVAFAEVEDFIDTPVKHYSSGMYLRLAFAVAAHLETDVLLVDEVLAVGDYKFQEKCLGKMQDVAATGRTILFVSHSITAMQRLCNRAIVLASGGVIADSSPEIAIAEYTGGMVENSFVGFPDPQRPTITKASIAMDQQDLLLSVEFESPYPLASPVLGYVIYDSLGTPLTGSDNRADPITPLPEAATIGQFKIAIPARYFRPGRYLVSLSLADFYVYHCQREMALKVDLNADVGGGLPALDFGSIYLPTQWSYKVMKLK